MGLLSGIVAGVQFPVVFHVLGHPVPAHPVLEMLGYTVGFQTYLLIRRRREADPLAAALVPAETMLWLLVACVFGAFCGAKILAWIESWPDYWSHRSDPAVWIGGKTIVGGIIGGWAGVEIAKKILGVAVRTGDGYVIPLCLGIAIGRIGCFLTGLPDHTYGTATGLPWGIDFGDGIRRHPTQLYEVIWLLGMAAIFWRAGAGWRRDTGGQMFRWFIVGYLLFRFAIEFIKPSFKPYAGFSAIQLTSLAAAGVAAWQINRPTAGKTMVSIL